MSEPERTAGVIPKARGVLEILVANVKRYEVGEISAETLDAIMYRVRVQASRACWCDEDVCCQVHHLHTKPHRRCLLR